MNADFLDALRQIEREKDIPLESLIKTMEQALQSAYKKNCGGMAVVRLRMEEGRNTMRMVLEKTVTDDVQNPHAEISLEEAQRINPDAEIGGTVDIPIAANGFGRIAAQTAKQVVVQRIREAERDKVFQEYFDRIGEVVTGTVQQREQRTVLIDLGKIEAVLPAPEQVPNEPYRYGDRIKLYILEVRSTSKGPQVIVSRTHPSLIRRLFELEVPEIGDGTVTIKSVAREPGARSKIAVHSRDDKVDPVGACVGHRGSRVQAVVNELYGERIDIVRWSDNPAEYISAALSPAKGLTVNINEGNKSAFVIAPENQLSLAIGREGQNVRLAARLTGWRIDIRTEAQAKELAAARLGFGPDTAREQADESEADPADAHESSSADEPGNPIVEQAAEPYQGSQPEAMEEVEAPNCCEVDTALAMERGQAMTAESVDFSESEAAAADVRITTGEPVVYKDVNDVVEATHESPHEKQEITEA